MNEPFGLFDTVPPDVMRCGLGAAFEPRKVPEFLGFKSVDVSHIAGISQKSVRYDENIPQQMKDRLEEIANTINMVASMFDGDADKTVTWFKASNPLLGEISPRDMIRLGRYERLRQFIVNAMIKGRHRVVENTIG